MKIPVALIAMLLSLTAWAQAAVAATQNEGSSAAAVTQTVRAFYTYHFAHDMGFSVRAVAARQRWLTPGLLSLCRDYFARPASPDEVPDVDGDPFTDTQEYPTSFRLQSVSRVVDGKAVATLRFSGGGGRAHALRVALKREGAAWLIDDVIYASGPSLRGLLAGADAKR